MPTKGSNFTRSPQEHLTRRDSVLDLNTQHQILLDCDAFENAKPADIAKKRPELYGKPVTDKQLYNAVKNKVRYYRKLKEEKPALYW